MINNNLMIATEKFIASQRLIEPKDKVLVALSGGPDSTALLHLLIKLQKKISFNLATAHLNHGIRGKEAARDQQFCIQLANSYQIPIYSKKISIHNKKKVSENTLRIYRYQFLQDVAKEIKANKIALGHQADDQIETIIMRLLRGAGTKGLSGIAAIREIQSNIFIIRPLINIWQEQIMDFLKKEKIPFVNDSSNQDNSFLRNKIRHKLIPDLITISPQIKNRLLAFTKQMSQVDNFLEREAAKKLKLVKNIDYDSYLISCQAVKKMHPAIASLLIIKMLKKLAVNLNPDSNQILKILALTDNDNGTQKIILANDILVKREYNNLIFTQKKAAKEVYFRKRLIIPGSLKIADANILITSEIIDSGDSQLRSFKNKSVNFKRLLNQKRLQFSVAFDYDKIKMPLIVRNRQDGDVFSPINGSGTKKLKKILIDNKIPKDNRDLIPIVEDKSRICWIVGYRIGEDVKIDSTTKKVLKLQVSNIK